jgi:hypothetical protein
MTTPIPAEDLPRLLAEALGWKKGGFEGVWFAENKVWATDEITADHFDDELFDPTNDHNDAQICVEECFKRGLGQKYTWKLWELMELKEGQGYPSCLLATPEQKSRAALAALTGK